RLSRHLEQLVMSLPAPQARFEALVQSTLSILQLCVDFAPPARERGNDDPLRTSILAYIDANLGDPDLGPDMLACKFGISRTWLYRIFAGSGGIKRCIRDKRLDAAFRDLCESPDRRVIDVAYHRGFSTERQFQRAFLQRFGSTPSEVRDRQKGGEPEPPSQPGETAASPGRSTGWARRSSPRTSWSAIARAYGTRLPTGQPSSVAS